MNGRFHSNNKKLEPGCKRLGQWGKLPRKLCWTGPWVPEKFPPLTNPRRRGGEGLWLPTGGSRHLVSRSLDKQEEWVFRAFGPRGGLGEQPAKAGAVSLDCRYLRSLLGRVELSRKFVRHLNTQSAAKSPTHRHRIAKAAAAVRTKRDSDNIVRAKRF